MRLAPEIFTHNIQESIAFYCDFLGFRIKDELDGFYVLQHIDNPEYELLLGPPKSPFVNKLFHPAFSGQGLIFQMEVDDVDAEYARLKKLGVKITIDLVEEEGNGRHFTITDPNGILIDIVTFV